MSLFKENYNNKKNTFVIAGGVASNNKIRRKLINLSIQKDFEPVFPPANLCSDNAANDCMGWNRKIQVRSFK